MLVSLAIFSVIGGVAFYFDFTSTVVVLLHRYTVGKACTSVLSLVLITRMAWIRRQQERDHQESRMKMEKEKTDFMAVLVHEMRNPLQTVVSMMEELRDASLTAKQMECVKATGMAVELMLQLADDVLNLEQLEQGRLQLHEESVDMWHLINVIAKQHEGQFKKKDVSFEVKISPSFPQTAIIDRTRINRILSHFLSNAIKFTDHGEVTLMADYESDSKMLHIQVQDTGAGMSQLQVTNLFVPYSPNKLDTFREKGGTGFGLAICKQLTILIGGSIQVMSTSGRGTTIGIRLPYKPAASAPQIRMSPSMSPSSSSSSLSLSSATNPIAATLDSQTMAIPTIPTTASDPTDNDITDILADVTLEEHKNNQLRRRVHVSNDGEAEAATTTMISQNSDVQSGGIDLSMTPVDNTMNITQLITPTNVPLPSSIVSETLSAVSSSRESALPMSGSADGHQITPMRSDVNDNKLSVLVVDDNTVVRKLLRRALTAGGYECVEAINGLEAVKLATSQPFLIILMDLTMPIMDGYTAARNIRAHGIQTPIIAITAKATVEQSDLVIDASMQCVLFKPVARADLIRKIQELT